MKFNSKPLKVNPLAGMINPSFRREFLDDMPNKAGSKVRGVDLALINQALRAITEGAATINGKAPANRAERFILIASYFRTARTPLNLPFDATASVKHKCNVSIRYNDQVFAYSFPEVPVTL
jgi:hypothetical protein